ncbi:hypothetical protein [Burkholderia multivorans]|uniref:hypothetical protein n=1 Tax=Burkholderia multivorans TaxID=87883 RepID=UPI002159553C|nr:hypothetical protein [Burkholderia multivorans]MDN7995947.1 hypothetical protein [Burkholderia multivorans]
MYWLARAARPATPAGDTPAAARAPALVSVGLVDDSVATNVGIVDVARIIADPRDEVERLTAERDAALPKADTWRANSGALEARIDELTLGPRLARVRLCS